MKPMTTRPARPTARTPNRFVPQVSLMEDRCTPATFFVDPTLVGAPGTPGVWNAGQPNATPVTIGVNGFATIQQALAVTVDTVTPGLDTINLSVGTHSLANTGGTAVVLGPNNPVGLVGSGAGATTVVPQFSGATNTDAVLQAAGTGAVLNLSALTFNGTGKNVSRAIFYSGGSTGTIDSAGVTGVSFPATPSNLGSGIVEQNSTITVTNSTINNYGRNGIVLDGGSGTIQGNVITGLANPNQLNYGVNILNNATALINGNTITQNLGGTASSTGAFLVSAAVNIVAPTNTVAPVKIYGNNLGSNQNGVLLTSAQGPSGVNASNVLVYANNFTNIPNFAIAAQPATAGSVDAPNNFYGGGAAPLNAPNGTTVNVAVGTTVLNSPAPVIQAASPEAYSQITGIPLSSPEAIFTFAAGAGSGPSNVQIFGADGTKLAAISPFGGGSFTNGIRVAQADVNGDGAVDTVVGTGPGGATRVQVISGLDNTTILADFQPFEASFTGGVFVATADMNGDGKAEVVVTPDKGGGARVKVYDGASLSSGGQTLLADFIGLADTQGRADDGFRGGCRPALGDVNGDGVPDLLVAAGFLGGPRITIWDGKGVAGGNGGKPTSNPLSNFFAFEQALRNGAFVSAGDVNGDGKADPIFGGGPGGGPRVRVADAAQVLAAGNFGSLDNQLGFTIANFFAGDTNSRGGIRVLGRDLDGDGFAEIVTGSGDNVTSDVRIYSNQQLRTNPNAPQVQKDINPFGASLANGVFVG